MLSRGRSAGRGAAATPDRDGSVREVDAADPIGTFYLSGMASPTAAPLSALLAGLFDVAHSYGVQLLDTGSTGCDGSACGDDDDEDGGALPPLQELQEQVASLARLAGFAQEAEAAMGAGVDDGPAIESPTHATPILESETDTDVEFLRDSRSPAVIVLSSSSGEVVECNRFDSHPPARAHCRTLPNLPDVHCVACYMNAVPTKLAPSTTVRQLQGGAPPLASAATPLPPSRS